MKDAKWVEDPNYAVKTGEETFMGELIKYSTKLLAVYEELNRMLILKNIEYFHENTNTYKSIIIKVLQFYKLLNYLHLHSLNPFYFLKQLSFQ